MRGCKCGASTKFPQFHIAVDGRQSGTRVHVNHAYAIGMGALGLTGVVFCYTLYGARLVPRPLSVWGVAGYGIIFCGMVSEFFGSGLGLASSIPGGLWEVFTGVWLITKGFSAPLAGADDVSRATALAVSSPKVLSATA